MLEPFSALAVATAVAQFLDFGSKLIKGSVQIYSSTDGALDDNRIIGTVAQDLEHVTDELTAKMQAVQWRSLSSNEAAVVSLAQQCKNVAQELRELLKRLEARPGSLKALGSLQASMKALRKKQKIGDLEKRLLNLQQELQTRLLAMLSDVQSAVIEKFNVLEKTNRKFEANTMSGLFSLKQALQDLATQRSSNDNQLNSLARNIADTIKDFVREAKEVEKHQVILSSLRFQLMELRRAEIQKAHAQTFAWIFDQGRTPFPEWACSSSGIFWISGKAGSGKSTLMKYLAPDKSKNAIMQGLLEQWANGKPMFSASHYFWSSGSSDQKSFRGLLRHLLYQILRQSPQTIPIVFADRWNETDLLSSDIWELDELEECFHRLVEDTNRGFKICLFIDGLDEYEGDQGKFVTMLQSLSCSPNLKICVSSRPWNVFQRSFGTSPNCLAVHELTKGDITRYVRFELANDGRFLSLLRREPHANDLITEIVNRADGVFLWIALVVRKLLEGLSDGDDVQDLLLRLRALPVRLEDYYREMLHRIDPVWRTLTVHTLRVALTAAKPQPILVYDCLRRERDDPDYALKGTTSFQNTAQVEEEVRRCREQLNKTVRDFLELRHLPLGPSESTQRVDFLHRTVRDFLATKEIYDFLQDGSSPWFEPHRSLFKATLFSVKTLQSREEISSIVLGKVIQMADEGLQYMASFEKHHGSTDRPHLQHLGQSLAESLDSFQDTGSGPVLHDVHMFLRKEKRTYLSMLVRQGLSIYVAGILDQTANLRGSKTPLLAYAFCPASFRWNLLVGDPVMCPAMIRVLVEHSADPNETFQHQDLEKTTPWRMFIEEIMSGRAVKNEATFEVVEYMIKNGAELDFSPSRTGHNLRTGKRQVQVLERCENLENVLSEKFPAKSAELKWLLAQERARRNDEKEAKKSSIFWRFLPF